MTSVGFLYIILALFLILVVIGLWSIVVAKIREGKEKKLFACVLSGDFSEYNVKDLIKVLFENKYMCLDYGCNTYNIMKDFHYCGIEYKVGSMIAGELQIERINYKINQIEQKQKKLLELRDRMERLL